MNHYKAALAVMAALAVFSAGCGNEAPPKQAAPQAATTTAPAIKAESEQLFQQGLKSYESFDYAAAIAAYDKALAADKNNYKALSGKGVALAMRGNSTGNLQDAEAGITLIKQALTLNPDYVPAYYDLALSYKIGRHYDDAIQWFQKVIEKEPDNTWSYYGIATIYGDKGQAKEAVAYLKKALARDKDNVRDAARSQAHFDSIRNDPAFKELVK